MTKKKSLVEKLQAQRSKKEPARKGVVAVLAHKEEIGEALNQGFTMKEIHAVMADDGEMPVGYAAFTRLVKKYIKGEEQKKIPIKTQADKTKPHIYNPDDYDEEKLF